MHSALAAPAVPGHAIAGERDGLPPAPRLPGAVCLTPEWLNLSAVFLLYKVLEPPPRDLCKTGSGECLRGGVTETATFLFSVQSE